MAQKYNTVVLVWEEFRGLNQPLNTQVYMVQQTNTHQVLQFWFKRDVSLASGHNSNERVQWNIVNRILSKVTKAYIVSAM